MDVSIYKNGIYVSGVDPIEEGFSPDDFMTVKIGQSDNNPITRGQRLAECQRQNFGTAIEHIFILTDQGDACVRKYLCGTFPLRFGENRSAGGRDVIKLLAKDLPFLLEQTTRYLNAINSGINVNDAKLWQFP